MMKKVLMMDNLDCANCAAKMQENVKKIDGVEDCSVSFMSQKMTLVYDETKEKEIFKAVQKAVRKVDPDCSVILK
jgi:copper chaperone CopZ